MAASKVFAVPELLEAILLELPPKKIFAVQAVAKQWKGLIDTSTQLKRAVFLNAIGKTPLARDESGAGVPNSNCSGE